MQSFLNLSSDVIFQALCFIVRYVKELGKAHVF